MAKSVAIEQQATQLEADASGMLAKMAKRLYIRRYPDRTAESDTEVESAGRRKPRTRNSKEEDDT